jgi:hypothetical protein
MFGHAGCGGLRLEISNPSAFAPRLITRLMSITETWWITPIVNPADQGSRLRAQHYKTDYERN